MFGLLHTKVKQSVFAMLLTQNDNPYIQHFHHFLEQIIICVLKNRIFFFDVVNLIYKYIDWSFDLLQRMEIQYPYNYLTAPM